MNDKFDQDRAWFRKGDSDLEGVRQLIAAGGPFDLACFHAQQAVEKYLKGILALSGCVIPMIHDLDRLQRIGTTDVQGWPFSGMDLSGLTGYAVELRYDFEFWPDRQQAVEALKLAEEMRVPTMKFAPNEGHP